MGVIKKLLVDQIKNDISRWREIVDKNNEKIRVLQCEKHDLLSQIKESKEILKELGVEE